MFKLNVVFLSGPRLCGKSALISMLVRRLCQSPPHYVRLVPVDDTEPRITLLGDLKSAGLASWQRINYTPEQIFEFFPDYLNEISLRGSFQSVLIEADADPNLRYAYPYDHRVFIMPVPDKLDDVFRSSDQAAVALREVMDDTAAFASEIFGMFDPDVEEDDAVHVTRVRDPWGRVERRVEITPAQMQRFIHSPLGVEVASRIQLQPKYQGLMESDVILMNRSIDPSPHIAAQASERIRTLIARVEHGHGKGPELHDCNPFDFSDPTQRQFMRKMQMILSPAEPGTPPPTPRDMLG